MRVNCANHSSTQSGGYKELQGKVQRGAQYGVPDTAVRLGWVVTIVGL